MDTIIGIYVACLLGIAARTIVPYLIQLKDNPDPKFNRKFLVPPLVSVVINVLAAPFGSSNCRLERLVGCFHLRLGHE